MKKRLFALALTAAMALTLLAGCGGDASSAGSVSGSETGSGSGGNTAAGQVYYLNFKPEQDAQWQELAELYTQETGVPVKVVTWMAIYGSLLPCTVILTLPLGAWFVLCGISTLPDLMLVLCLSLSIGIPLLKALGFMETIPNLNYKITASFSWLLSRA